MAASFDRRRANAPEDTTAPTYDVRVASLDARDGPAWSVNDNWLLHSKRHVPSENLALLNVPGGEEGDTPSVLAQSDPAAARAGRSATDERSMRAYGFTGAAHGQACRRELCLVRVEVSSSSAAIRRSPVPCTSAPLTALTSRHGPRQVRGRQYIGKAELSVDFQLAPFSGARRRRPGKDVESQSLAAFVQQALTPAVRLELLPKSSIDIHITVIDLDTSEIGCAALAVTAASAALAEAGIEMLGLVCGASAVRVRYAAWLTRSLVFMEPRLTSQRRNGGSWTPRQLRRQIPARTSRYAACQRSGPRRATRY